MSCSCRDTDPEQCATNHGRAGVCDCFCHRPTGRPTAPPTGWPSADPGEGQEGGEASEGEQACLREIEASNGPVSPRVAQMVRWAYLAGKRDGMATGGSLHPRAGQADE